MTDWTIHLGDVRDVLQTLPDASVQCVVTSPPYFGLRDYGTGTWSGGDPACDHVGIEPRTVSGGLGKQYTNVGSNRVFSGDCRCGARRIDNQIGLEPTPDAYVAQLVEVFRDVRRVLLDDGTVWLNLGDSYATAGTKQTGRRDELPEYLNRRAEQYGTGRVKALSTPTTRTTRSYQMDVKPKDLIGIPWRVAFALQADGWYLRSDIIWAKKNCMPESVQDRPTRSHEYIFLLSKAERYFYDADAIKESASADSGYAKQRAKGIDTWAYGRTAGGNTTNGIGGTFGDGVTRNKRSVWTVATQPFPDAHFATFPEELPETCIKAGSRPGDTVLDPFCGAGTTGLVALHLGRKFIGIELNPEYRAMAIRRIEDSAPLFLRGEQSA